MAARRGGMTGRRVPPPGRKPAEARPGAEDVGFGGGSSVGAVKGHFEINSDELQDMAYGRNAWDNIQEVIRFTFKQVFEEMSKQSSRHMQLFQQVQLMKRNQVLATEKFDRIETLTASSHERDAAVTSLSRDMSSLAEDLLALKRDVSQKADKALVRDAISVRIPEPSKTQELEDRVEKAEARLLRLHEVMKARDSVERCDRIEASIRRLQEQTSHRRSSELVATDDFGKTVDDLQGHVRRLQEDVNSLASSLDGKANKSSVAAALHRKANKTSVDSQFRKVTAQLTAVAVEASRVREDFAPERLPQEPESESKADEAGSETKELTRATRNYVKALSDNLSRRLMDVEAEVRSLPKLDEVESHCRKVFIPREDVSSGALAARLSADLRPPATAPATAGHRAQASISADQLTSLDSQITSLSDRIDGNSSKIGKLQTSLAHLQRDVANPLAPEDGDTRPSSDTAAMVKKAQHAASRAKSAAASSAHCESKLESVSEEVRMLGRELTAIQATLRTYVSSSSHLQRELGTLSEATGVVEGRIDESKRVVLDTAARVEMLEAETKRLSDNLRHTNARLDDVSAEATHSRIRLNAVDRAYPSTSHSRVPSVVPAPLPSTGMLAARSGLPSSATYRVMSTRLGPGYSTTAGHIAYPHAPQPPVAARYDAADFGGHFQPSERASQPSRQEVVGGTSYERGRSALSSVSGRAVEGASSQRTQQGFQGESRTGAGIGAGIGIGIETDNSAAGAPVARGGAPVEGGGASVGSSVAGSGGGSVEGRAAGDKEPSNPVRLGPSIDSFGSRPSSRRSSSASALSGTHHDATPDWVRQKEGTPTWVGTEGAAIGTVLQARPSTYR